MYLSVPPKHPKALDGPRSVLHERRTRLLKEQRGLRELAGLTTVGGIGGAAGAVALFTDGVLTAGVFTAILTVGAWVVLWRQGRRIRELKSDLDYIETVQLLEEHPS